MDGQKHSSFLLKSIKYKKKFILFLKFLLKCLDISGQNKNMIRAKVLKYIKDHSFPPPSGHPPPTPSIFFLNGKVKIVLVTKKKVR
jgi:hypothetical protein